QVAKRQAITNPENTVYSIKRFMGRRYSEINEEARLVPYKVVEADNGDARVEIEGKVLSPPEISAMILQKMKDAAEQFLGDKVDKRIIEWIIAEFKREQGIDLGKDKMALQRLREAAEKAKQELSTTLETEINLPFVTADASGPKHLALRLTRSKFEQLVADLLERTMGPVRQCLADAGVQP